MNGRTRQMIRLKIDQMKREEQAIIRALGKGRCGGCGERHEDYNLACQRCRDRKKRREDSNG